MKPFSPEGKSMMPNFAAALSRPGVFTYISLFLLSLASTLSGQVSAFEGYTLYNSNNSRSTHLINMQKQTVHTWNHALGGGYSVYLLENGNLLRPAAIQGAQLRGAAYSGLIQEINWSGQVVWEYPYSSPTYIAHHDIEPMPNGNILLIAWEVKSSAQASAMGRTNPTVLWPDHIVEVRPTRPSGGTIVWEWHAWDHLVQDKDPAKPNYGVISEHPGRLNINLASGAIGPGGGDWLHINGISYNPERDEVVISSHFMNEFYVIDHGTTTAEAAGNTGGRRGKGGDILYRWGKPSNYGAAGNTVFDVVHCSWWVPKGLPGEGNILAFNNNARSRASVIVEVTPPLDAQGNYMMNPGVAFGPSTPTWSYSNGNTFFSNHLGGNQRLPNGNTLIAQATSGIFLEVTPSGQIVWQHNVGRETARVLRYAPEYPGLSALFPTGVDGPEAPNPDFRIANFPNPFYDYTILHYSVTTAGPVRISLRDVTGRQVAVFTREHIAPGHYQAAWDGVDQYGNRAVPGMYLCRIQSGTEFRTHKLLLLGD